MSFIRQDFRNGFPFIGGDPALDFVNTRPVQDGLATELLTDLPALIRWFCSAGLLEEERAAALVSEYGASPEGHAVLEEILRLREILRERIIALESSGRVNDDLMNELNGWLRRYPVRMRLVKRGRKFVTITDPAPATLEDLVAILVSLASAMVSTRKTRRIRKCDSCILHFYDRTKSHTRRWCSMRICGNRAKVAAYAARKRKENEAR